MVTPGKGGVLVVSLFGLVLPVGAAVDRKSGSRWSARSVARTNDLEAGEDPPHAVGLSEDKVVCQVMWCLLLG